MTEYNVHLKWQRETRDFDYKTYDRKHTIFFYGGPKIEVSAAPDLYRNPQFHSPEELFVAAISSCFMLTFLSLAAKTEFIVNTYLDSSTCILGKIGGKKQAITEVILRPVITFHKDNQPDLTTINKLFQTAHDLCFIANSVTATITVNPQIAESRDNEATG